MNEEYLKEIRWICSQPGASEPHAIILLDEVERLRDEVAKLRRQMNRLENAQESENVS
jgi:hypothetical protein